MAKTVRTPIGGDTDKKKRLPLFDQRDRMSFKKDPTKHRIWVNDVDGELDRYLDSGFSFVRHEERGEGSIEDGTSLEGRVSVNVGRAGTGENVQAYLVEMPIDEWLDIKEQIAEERKAPLKEIGEQTKQMQKSGFYGPGLQGKITGE